MQSAPSYGCSQHYMDDKGKDYFAYQVACGLFIGRINARRFFQPTIGPDDVVLDFGAGPGIVLNSLKCGRKFAVETNPKAREFCQQQFGLQTFPDTSSVASDSVDVAISCHCLEHVPYPIGALLELRRVVKAGGQVLLLLPLDDWRAQKRDDPADIDHHLHTWTPLLLGNMLREAGLHPVEIRVVTYAVSRRVERLERILPTCLFDLICRLFAAVRKRRQIFARCART